jgi:hypothetical protein
LGNASAANAQTSEDFVREERGSGASVISGVVWPGLGQGLLLLVLSPASRHCILAAHLNASGREGCHRFFPFIVTPRGCRALVADKIFPDVWSHMTPFDT